MSPDINPEAQTLIASRLNVHVPIAAAIFVWDV